MRHDRTSVGRTTGTGTVAARSSVTPRQPAPRRQSCSPRQFCAVLLGVCLLVGTTARGARPAAKPAPKVEPTIASQPLAGDASRPLVAGRSQVPLAGEWKIQFVQGPNEPPGEMWEPKLVELPKTVRMPGKQLPNQEKIFKSGAWLERDAAIPSDWQGRRIVLRIGRCLYGIAVYVNGQKAGEIPGYGGEVDVTSQATPGRTVTLRLYCGRLGKGLASLDQISRIMAAYNVQRDPGGAWLCAPTGPFGLPEEFCLESRAPDLCVEDVWYRTTVRGGARIDTAVTVWSASPRDGLTCRVRIYAPDSDKPVLEGPLALGRVPAGRSRHCLVLPATTLKLWGILEPNLYVGQAMLLDAGGKEIDRSEPVRFGVREFWAQGRRLYLNGRPVCPVPAFCGDPKDLDALVATGVNMVQREFPYWFKFYNEDFRALAAGCDERGVLLSASGITHHELNLADPDVLHKYGVWAEHYYRRHQNHPSIVVYGLGINAPGNFNDFSPAKMGRTSNWDWTNTGTTRSYLISRDFDPTRLYYFHGGPRGGDIGSANFYPNHTPIQEVEDWPCEWAEKGDRPFMTLEGLLAQFSVDYEKSGVVYLTEYAARHVGDAAYPAESSDYRDYITYQRPRQSFWDLVIKPEFNRFADPLGATALLRGGRAWRWLGVPFNQWAGLIGSPGYKKDQPETAFLRAAADLRRPAMAWIGGPENDFSLKDHNFYSGQTVEKTLMGIYDRAGNATWEAVWQLKARASGAAAARGQFSQKMSPFSRAKTPFRFRLPDVKAPTDFDLTLAVQDKAAGGPVATDSFAITVYPRPAAVTMPTGAPFFVFDPEGETTAWLTSLGVAVTPWKRGSAAPGRVLVIGRRALRAIKAMPFTAQDVEAGIRVVIFEQHCSELDKIGLRHEDRCPRQVFIRQGDHPLAARLTHEALRDWQGHASLISEGPLGDRLAVSSRSFHTSNRGNVASNVIETPHFGPFMPVLDCEFDLSYTALMSWRHGQGEVLFCQLDLTGRIGREPAADLVARNLLQYLATPQDPRVEKTAVCLNKDDAEMVRALGFAADPSPRDALSPARHVLVVTGAKAQPLAAYRERIQPFLDVGGEMLVLYATEQLLADPLFAGRVKAQRARVAAGAIEVPRHPLLRGVGPQNLHWRATADLIKLTSEDKTFVSLLDGLIGVLPCGKGRIVLMQVEPKQIADLAAAKELDPLAGQFDPKTKQPKYKPLTDARLQNDRRRTVWHVNRLHSLLLANLGLRSSDALVERLCKIKPTMPTTPVNEWVVMGPVPPTVADENANPLDRDDLGKLASHRDPAYEFVNARGEKVKWTTPSDSQNGLGLEGKNDLGKIYGVRLRDTAIAVTHLWSTRDREATIGFGADWWIQVNVNGTKMFQTASKPWTFGINFDRKLKVPLRAGWNEIVCYVAAGGNGHIFWFEINNPGDLVVAQQLKAPADPPAGLPRPEDLVPDNIDPGYMLYTEIMTGSIDPYAYIPW